MKIVIVTGMSGAGKSSAMKSMEDAGYYCLDNMPPVLLSNFISLCESSVEGMEKIALGVDIRGGVFFEDFRNWYNHLKSTGYDCKILFVEASDEALIKRFKELRRPHPLSGNNTLVECIEMERKKLSPLRQEADYIIDTSTLGINEFRNQVKDKFREDTGQPNISIICNSFGFKKGIAIDADLVFDVRFLPNPFYIEELREKTGNDIEVQNYVMSFEESKVFLEKTKDMIDYLLPFYIKEGKTQLMISFGCTGGRHRSVTMANKLGEYLKIKNYRVYIKHRDS